jgi:glycosyltransferase involved in cell wall biosynthesis
VRVVILSTYPPRRCGIASFTADLRDAVREADPAVDVEVVAVVSDDAADEADCPEVVRVLRQHRREDYERTASWVNRTRPDVVLVEHEFGIFGGADGRDLLELTHRLEVPYVVTLHTVLSRPSTDQLEVLRALCGRAAQVTVFSTTARNLLLAHHVVDQDRVAVVVHGAPADLRPSFRELLDPGRRGAHATGLRELSHVARPAPLLATFGLLSPGKGIETVVRALPHIADAVPDVLYVVAGRTHPEVVRRHGESYRDSLRQLAERLGVADHVVFVDRFLDAAELRRLLAATTVFLTPYRSYEQIVSGVLTYAVVAACPVVSTPYLYATDLLTHGAGRVVPFDDEVAVARHVTELLRDPQAHATAVAGAHRRGAHHAWPEVGRQLLKVLVQASEPHESLRRPTPTPRSSGRVPLGHLARLTDDAGIVQHARETRPDHATGYCVDDVARVGVVARGLLASDPANPWFGDLARNTVRFLREAVDPATGLMHNLRAVDGAWLDEPHAGDHVGRSVWALGELAASRHHAVQGDARDLLEVLGEAPADSSLRSAAFALLGLSRLLEVEGGAGARAQAEELVDFLAARLEQCAGEGWWWFEETLTYDNARLPQGLLAAARVLDDAATARTALRALDWYGEQCRVDGPEVVLVGNRWRSRTAGADRLRSLAPDGGGGPLDEGDEQPLDAAALVEAYVEAFRTAGRAADRGRAVRVLEWFHGRNRWGLPLVDEASQGCHDGVGPTGVNANQGAESTLAYLQARLALDGLPRG